MRDFFEAQDRARRQTRWLVLGFVVAILAVVVAVDVLLWAFLGVGVYLGMGQEGLFLLVGVSVMTGLIILGCSGFKMLELNSGGAVVAKDLGGRLVGENTRDTDERKLVNVVEEMAIASGIPCPQIFLLDEEYGINAFAAGTESSNAVVGVTRGAIKHLSRSELQGVVAHEFSHILNGDMRLNMRLIGFVFGLMSITIIGRSLLRVSFHIGRGSKNREGMSAGMSMVLLGVGLIAIGGVGWLAGRFLQAAISRQREYLADASAVQFTRNPDGLAKALKKLGGSPNGSRVRAPKAIEASHLFFADGGFFSMGLQTHPRLDSRIRALDPSWDGEYVKSKAMRDQAEKVQSEARDWDAGKVVGLPRAIGLAGSVADSINPERVEVGRGQAVLESLTSAWVEAARDRRGAQTLIFALLIQEEGGMKKNELSVLREFVGTDMADLAVEWQEGLRGVNSAQKIALVDLAVPSLRCLGEEELEQFLAIMESLITADQRVDLFEFMLQQVVRRHVSLARSTRRGFPKIKYRKIQELSEQAGSLLSAIVSVGEGGEKAFDEALRWWAGQWEFPSFQPEVQLEEVATALAQFDLASPMVKKQLIQICARAVAFDEKVEDREAELLRAIADGIGCGIPPFVERVEKAG